MKRPRTCPLPSPRVLRPRLCPALSLHTRTHSFFDRLPEDTLLHIIRRLSTLPAPTPATCPLLSLARASPAARRAVASTVGARLAFSVYGSADWFWAWLAVAGGGLRDLALHRQSSRTAGDVTHMWATWPRKLAVQLEAGGVLGGVREVGAKLVELDLSGLQSFRRTSIFALEELLETTRETLRCLKIDLGHFRIGAAVGNARLTRLRRLTVVFLGERSEGGLLGVLRSMQGQEGQGCAVRELFLEKCDGIPSVFRRHRAEMERLLPQLAVFLIDYDDELQDFSSPSSESFENLIAAATLPTLQRICFSGSGVPVTPKLVSEIRAKCAALAELRLVDCDVDPSERPGGFGHCKLCNEALSCTGSVLTHYYPRWVTFKLAHLDTLAKHCTGLTHLRIFTAPDAEEALGELGKSLSERLVDLEVYPKKHERKREVASTIVDLVQQLRKLERLCLVTLDLSTKQLETVLQHCGEGLKLFSFSPAVFSGDEGEQTAECIADVLLCAAMNNRNLHRVECILPNDRVPVVKTIRVARKLGVALRTLESRAPRIESASIASLIEKMTERELVGAGTTAHKLLRQASRSSGLGLTA